MKFKVGDLVEFNIVSDDSDYASNLFGVEDENDWFYVSVYTSVLYGEIIKNKVTIYLFIQDKIC